MTRDRALMTPGAIPLPDELAALHPGARALWPAIGPLALRVADQLLRFGSASPPHLAEALGAAPHEIARALDELTAAGAASCVYVAGGRIYTPT